MAVPLPVVNSLPNNENLSTPIHVETNNSEVESSCSSTESNKSVSPADILPIPKLTTKTSKRAGAAAVVTSSPYKNNLSGKFQAKKDKLNARKAKLEAELQKLENEMQRPAAKAKPQNRKCSKSAVRKRMLNQKNQKQQ